MYTLYQYISYYLMYMATFIFVHDNGFTKTETNNSSMYIINPKIEKHLLLEKPLYIR